MQQQMDGNACVCCKHIQMTARLTHTAVQGFMKMISLHTWGSSGTCRAHVHNKQIQYLRHTKGFSAQLSIPGCWARHSKAGGSLI